MRDHGLRSFDAVIAHYLAEKAGGADGELRWFAIQRSLRDAIRLAAMAERPGGKRFRHQTRIPRKALKTSAQRLLRAQHHLERCDSFHALYRIVKRVISGIPGIGELTVYDTALRIGAKLDLAPERVYLHAGTRAGAEVLGFDRGVQWIQRKDLPSPLDRLEARQIEDILCIYKVDLSKFIVPSATSQESDDP